MDPSLNAAINNYLTDEFHKITPRKIFIKEAEEKTPVEEISTATEGGLTFSDCVGNNLNISGIKQITGNKNTLRRYVIRDGKLYSLLEWALEDLSCGLRQN